MTMADKICEVCNRDGAVGVASSSLVAMSRAICLECLGAGAEQEMVFEFEYDVSDHGAGLDQETMDYFCTWKDGCYWTWKEWLAWRRIQPDITGVHS